MTPFPVGARVLVDGRDPAIVKQAFPEGSSSYLFPHYKRVRRRSSARCQDAHGTPPHDAQHLK